MLALYKSNIENVKLAGTTNREETYKTVTQFSLGPAETLTYLVPGFFGWHLNSGEQGLYWGWIGEWPDYPKKHLGTRNLNLAISTTGTIATVPRPDRRWPAFARIALRARSCCRSGNGFTDGSYSAWDLSR